MDALFGALERLSHQALTAAEYTSLVFYLLTVLLVLLTYTIARQDWAEISAWAALGTIMVAIHFMIVSWHVVKVPKLFAADSLGERSRFRDCPDCPEMVIVPSGYFDMGADDAAAKPEEGPTRRMMIPKRLAISRERVSAKELESILKAAGGLPSACPGSGAPCVSWRGAQAYAAGLTHRTGFGYRLPSAAEWEFAARAGAAAPSDVAGRPVVMAGLRAPAPSSVTNGFALVGMTAGAAEFVADCWSETLSPLRSDGSALRAPFGVVCRNHVVKVGEAGQPVRFSGRLPVRPDAPLEAVGFRVVRELPREAR